MLAKGNTAELEVYKCSSIFGSEVFKNILKMVEAGLEVKKLAGVKTSQKNFNNAIKNL